MASYNFATLTPDQAWNISVGDYLALDGGPANQARVVYSPQELTVPAHIQVSWGGRTLLFGPELSDLSLRGALEVGDHSRLLIGGDGRSYLRGGQGGDGLFGGGGDDTVVGGDGDDYLQGNSGDDLILGGAGRNTIFGGQGADIIDVTPGDDSGSWIQGNKGADELYGGIGADTLLGGQDDDVLSGADADDHLQGDLGDDQLRGGFGADTLLGGGGDDRLEGNSGQDLLYGGDGNDRLVSEGMEPGVLWGEAGADTLTAAAAGRDVLNGGEGRDLFEIVSRTAPGAGLDAEIRDFEPGDLISFPQVSIYAQAGGILPRSYSEFVADDYAQALATAHEHISAAGAVYVAAQVGQDVYVFADTGGPQDGADVAILLVGRTLTDVSLQNFI